jgi:hypothetical protein
MHRAVFGRAGPVSNVVEPWIGVRARGLDPEGGRLVHSVPVDDVSNLEPGESYFADALELVAQIVAVETLLVMDVGEDPVPLTLSNVERLPVARVRLCTPSPDSARAESGEALR